MREHNVYLGDEITHSITAAINSAVFHQDTCYFDFNGCRVIVDAESDAELIHRDWLRAMRLGPNEKPQIGPRAESVLSPEEIAKDAEIKAASDAKVRQAREEYAQECSDKRKYMELLLAEALPLDLIDPDGWRKFAETNKSAYGARCVTYAEDWGRLMQRRLAIGESVSVCAYDTSRTADYDGITGHMHGMATLALIHMWKHGAELQQWREADKHS